MAIAKLQRARSEPTGPPVEDPLAVHHAFRQHRRKRLARIDHRREQQTASKRFWLLIGGLFLLALLLGVTIWEQIQSIFGI
jgi:hypothetical protein